MAVGCGVLLATMAFGPRSRAGEPSDARRVGEGCPATTTPTPFRVPRGAVQVVTVAVPAVAVIDLADGAPRRAWTNSGRPPAPGDEVYVRDGDALVDATSGVADLAIATSWVAAEVTCRPEWWDAVSGP